MSNGLFRPEIFIARQRSAQSAIRVRASRMGWVAFGVGTFIVVLSLLILGFGKYTRHVRVSGFLKPSSDLITVTPPSEGLITRVFVQEAAGVKKNQPLFEISSEEGTMSGGGTWASIANELLHKRDRLMTDINEQKHLVGMQEAGLRERIALLHSQIHEAEAQIAIQNRRAKSAEELYRQWAGLQATGVVSKLQVLQQHDLVLQIEYELREISGQAYQLKQQASVLQDQLTQLPIALSSKISEIDRALADVNQSIATNDLRRAAVLRAPSDGFLSNLLVHAGHQVSSQQPLATIAPAGAQLVAELWIPSREAGAVRKGDRVVLRYAAYPYETYGQQVGKVAAVSNDAIPPRIASRLLGGDFSDSVLKATVLLPSQNIQINGAAEGLKSGLSVTADILVERRRLFEWIFDPVRGFKHDIDAQASIWKEPVHG